MNEADGVEVPNQIPQHDTVARREKLKKITELGLKHMEDKKVRKTLLGHEIVLQDVAANVGGAVAWAEDYIKGAIKDLPYASIVMAGISLVLPLLKNPTAVESANKEGFTYVTSQMRYYAAMESLLLPEDMKAELKADLTERLVEFYKLIINFQVKSVIRFYQTRTKNFFRGTINYDGWDKKLQDIKECDAALFSKFGTAISGNNLQVLRELACQAEASRKALDDLLMNARELVNVSQKMDRRMSDAENRACLRDLKATDPRDDKDRIEQDRGGLLKDSYAWVLNNDEFKQWRDNEESQLLWIKGDPGKGKTMLLCGIIDELTKSTKHSANVSFFFCQATNADLNNAVNILRGLLYMLAKQQQSLLCHIRERYDDSGKQCFIGMNAWTALSKMFISVLGDPHLRTTYLIIDALDECTTDLTLLLRLVSQKSSASSRIKWIVSSRNWPSIEEHLNAATQKVRLCLELNEKSIAVAVNRYIRLKVEQLAVQKKYDNDTQDAVQRHLSSNANDTFLWVALVCQELAHPNVRRHHTLQTLQAFPPGLDQLYKRMMDQICSSKDVDLCKSILGVVSVVCRPITLVELVSFIDMPGSISDDYEALMEIIGLCGSFLTLRERTISFVHQSAKDYLLKKAFEQIFPSGMEEIHYTIFLRSLQIMYGTLRRDIYGLHAPGFHIDEIKQPSPDPLAAARYSCVYWVEHLCNCDPSKRANNDLRDGGSVDNFIRRNYLYWLEALSLLGRMSEGILSMVTLSHLVQVRFLMPILSFYYLGSVLTSP